MVNYYMHKGMGGEGTIRRCGLIGGSVSLWGRLIDPPPSCLRMLSLFLASFG